MWKTLSRNKTLPDVTVEDAYLSPDHWSYEQHQVERLGLTEYKKHMPGRGSTMFGGIFFIGDHLPQKGGGDEPHVEWQRKQHVSHVRDISRLAKKEAPEARKR